MGVHPRNKIPYIVFKVHFKSSITNETLFNKKIKFTYKDWKQNLSTKLTSFLNFFDATQNNNRNIKLLPPENEKKEISIV